MNHKQAVRLGYSNDLELDASIIEAEPRKLTAFD